jgi:hypothetical protein
MLAARILLTTVLAAAAGPVASGPLTVGVPPTVSPGSAEGSVPIASRCPTFSWGLVAGAAKYQIEVAAVAEDGSDAASAATLLRAEVPGSATSWTPAGVACLRTGLAHAWRIRASSLEGWGEWSEWRLFIPMAEAAVDSGADRSGDAGDPSPDAHGWTPSARGTAGPARHRRAAGSGAPDRKAVPGVPAGLQVDYAIEDTVSYSATGVYASAEVLYGLGTGGNAVGVRGVASGGGDSFYTSTGVFGEGDDYGVRGDGSTGVWGDGDTGVFGSGSYVGVSAYANDEAALDLEVGGDVGRVGTYQVNSDLSLEAGDDVLVILDHEADSSGSNFVIRHGTSNDNLFYVTDSGQVVVAETIVHGSDVGAKTDLRPVDGADILRRLVEMPVQRWRWKDAPADEGHLGPTAQDFSAAFGLGGTPKGIATVDADGVALAAIQELARRVEAQREHIEALRRRVGTTAEGCRAPGLR